MKKVVTKEAVIAATKQIEKRKERATIERIRAITGGSPKTISAIKNTINNDNADDNVDDIALSLFDNAVTDNTIALSYHNVETQTDAMIMKRLDNIITTRLKMILSCWEENEKTEAVEKGPQPKTSAENEALTEALSEMRELWLDACSLFSMAKSRADTAAERLNLLETEKANQALEIKRITKLETEDNDRTETGRRVFKDELARAVHHLVMTAGMPPKEITILLNLSSSDVSRLKIRGTKLHQKKQ